MKRALLRFLFAAVLACGFLFAQDIRAQSFEVDGAMYTATSATTCSTEQYSKNIVTNNEAYSGDYVIPEKVVHDGVTYTVTAIGDETFHDCVDLTSVSIPSTVTKIGEYAFQKCTGLSSIIIPETVTAIGERAFVASGLQTADVKARLVQLNKDVFTSCRSLRSVTLPSSLITIGEGVFYGCTSLEGIDIPASVRTIGESAFGSCEGLRSVVLPTSLGVINEYVFYNCTSLESIEIPEGVMTIGSFAFLGCTGLVSVKMPDTVSEIGARAFDECTSLVEFNMPASLTVMPIGEFSNTGLYKFELLEVEGTTAEFKFTTSITGVEKFVGMYNGTHFDIAPDGLVTFTGLAPDGCTVYLGCFTSKGKYLDLDYASVPTDGVSIDIDVEILSPMEVVAHGSFDAGDAEVGPMGFELSYSYNTSRIFRTETGEPVYNFTDLEPGNGYIAYFYIFANGKKFTAESESFYMPKVTLTTLPAEAISNTVARICADTNLPDGTEGTGFEWRRYDAPDEMPSSTAECPVIDGKLTGTLNNLSQSTYYKFRPYYTSENGKTQYGEWVAFITADAYVYFEPTVRTYEAADITETTAAVSAAAVQGSDAITEQGFEYWPTATRSAAMRMEAAVPHSVQTVTALGQVMTATLEGLQPGTGYTFRAYAKTAKGTTYGNELTFTTQTSSGIQSVPITGGAVETARYDAAGRKVSSPVRGLNIVVMSDGSVRKEIVR